MKTLAFTLICVAIALQAQQLTIARTPHGFLVAMPQPRTGEVWRIYGRRDFRGATNVIVTNWTPLGNVSAFKVNGTNWIAAESSGGSQQYFRAFTTTP